MEKISIQDGYVFGSVMSNLHLCKHLIQIILPDLKVKEIKFPVLEKGVQEDPHSHGVRFDVYTEDSNAVYEIDMQVRKTKALPQRIRYYQGRIDSDLLSHGDSYERLKQTYVIFICPFDPFGNGLCKYEFQNVCINNPRIRMNDGRTVIFLNTKGTANDVSQPLQNFLQYVDNKDVQDDSYVKEIASYIHRFSRNVKWRNGYMDNKTHMMFHDEDVREAGIEEGIARGKKETLVKTVRLLQQMKIPKTQIKQKLQTDFALSEDEITTLLATVNSH
ncbi:MAG TPA: Rpn family recombination-promoting nuclease/putative transposase [Candidatus Limosilactobacillus excrementigallinarum]|nr:Rpn family recombination-promoting nuclease/putative transposase [Candidatus Limosilactobacillus excrementigallinarum]